MNLDAAIDEALDSPDELTRADEVRILRNLCIALEQRIAALTLRVEQVIDAMGTTNQDIGGLIVRVEALEEQLRRLAPIFRDGMKVLQAR